ncbi:MULTISPECIES: homoserine O-acetyltransferase [unclassified Cryobacterium]|uniref:homoserine O-acetyltransferase MetX n=1 Tax=unclassified Cryobacterium TaxID=2649013 RepID=UPI00106CB872|nr:MULTISPECIES: homoserine O-acetyltransferase [unclassified Cryobacterium]TFC51776.1 homoserine O-acetyltransferase [Cryobacterium sp. TMB3-1-2]TFC68872.1 homoserine O-acetyltransferase [Cryobacterium sp. TMB3-15]TFC72274.1 homoserine O-acetyltransferase [Cryobacterium sp. TMB3-10]TFD38495.1 homoserine O-acetyltransferase [Cryobacterium sp. TMB3-12]
MEWQYSADTVPSSLVTDAQARSLLGKPPVTGAWRDGDPVGGRRFVDIGALDLEAGGHLAGVRIAYESWGELNPAGDNAVLVLHALTGDSHVVGPPAAGHPTAGWWSGIVGRGLAIDTDRWFVVAPNMLGGCQGSTGPASLAPDGSEWGPQFPYLSIRDQVAAQAAFSDRIGVERWAGIVGGSMGGMHVLEWGIEHPGRVTRLGILAAPPVTTADQIALNSVQIEAIRTDPLFRAGDYYDAEPGDGPSRGLALARRMALLNYRSPSELNSRFERSWQSDITPLGGHGRFAVESYLDFHGNKFTRRFDANSYITLVEAMNSHDIGRGRGGVDAALARITARTLVVGIDSDRLFPLDGQRVIAAGLGSGGDPVVIESGYGHDGFLIEDQAIGDQLRWLLG